MIVQGVLGGLRVTQINRNFAIVHACLAQAFFALLCGIAWFTSREWWQGMSTTAGETARKLRRLSLMTTCFIYVQLIFGAILRHTGSRLDAHLIFAFLVALHIFLLARRMLAVDSVAGGIGQSMPLLLLGLLGVQLMLGTGAFFAKLTAFGETFAAALTVTITTAHVAVRRTHVGQQLCADPENLPVH